MKSLFLVLLLVFFASSVFASNCERILRDGSMPLVLINEDPAYASWVGARPRPLAEIVIHPKIQVVWGNPHTQDVHPLAAWRTFHEESFPFRIFHPDRFPEQVSLNTPEFLRAIHRMVPLNHPSSELLLNDLFSDLRGFARRAFYAHRKLAQLRSATLLGLSRTAVENGLRNFISTNDYYLIQNKTEVALLLQDTPALDGIEFEIADDGGVVLNLSTNEASLWEAIQRFESPWAQILDHEKPIPTHITVYFFCIPQIPIWKLLLLLEQDISFREVHIGLPFPRERGIRVWNAADYSPK